MKMGKIKAAAITSLLLATTGVTASEYLTGDALKTLFSDKTYDIHNLETGKKFRAYTAPNGERYLDIHWKNTIAKRRWWIDGNQYCGSHPKRGDYCRDVKDAGDGVFHIVFNGNHIRTFSNFRDGRDVDL